MSHAKERPLPIFLSGPVEPVNKGSRANIYYLAESGHAYKLFRSGAHRYRGNADYVYRWNAFMAKAYGGELAPLAVARSVHPRVIQMPYLTEAPTIKFYRDSLGIAEQEFSRLGWRITDNNITNFRAYRVKDRAYLVPVDFDEIEEFPIYESPYIVKHPLSRNQEHISKVAVSPAQLSTYHFRCAHQILTIIVEDFQKRLGCSNDKESLQLSARDRDKLSKLISLRNQKHLKITDIKAVTDIKTYRCSSNPFTVFFAKFFTTTSSRLLMKETQKSGLRI